LSNNYYYHCNIITTVAMAGDQQSPFLLDRLSTQLIQTQHNRVSQKFIRYYHRSWRKPVTFSLWARFFSTFYSRFFFCTHSNSDNVSCCWKQRCQYSWSLFPAVCLA